MPEPAVASVSNNIQNLMADMKVSEKGAKRVSEIIKAGVEILMEEGFLALTKRRIAARLHIAHGHVGYYFPTRESLWRAVFDYEIHAYYHRHFDAMRPRRGTDAQANFDSFVRQWIKEFSYIEMRILFSQLNAVGELIPLVAKFRDEIWSKLYAETYDRTASLNPVGLDPSVLRLRVLRMIASMEGLHVVTGFNRGLLHEKRFTDGIIEHMNALARGLITDLAV